MNKHSLPLQYQLTKKNTNFDLKDIFLTNGI